MRAAGRRREEKAWEAAVAAESGLRVWYEVKPAADWLERHILRGPADDRDPSAALLMVLAGRLRWAFRTRRAQLNEVARGRVACWCDLCGEVRANRIGRAGA